MKLSASEIIYKTRTYNLAGWHSEESPAPLTMVKGEGVYFWDVHGKRYFDWSSMQINVNVGHAHPKMVKAIQQQAGKMTCLSANITTETRARLGENLARITPVFLRKNYLTAGGNDAFETALKIARLYSGRQKILVRHPSFHEEVLACSGPYQLPAEFDLPWLVQVPDPCSMHDPSYSERSPEESDRLLVEIFTKKIAAEGSKNIAAILLAGYTSENGISQGGEFFWRSVQEICEQNGILLIVDEIFSGFGRTGEWFGIDHYPFVRPDILILANGISAGYVPLGAVMVSDSISDRLAGDVNWCGLNYNTHSLACAAALASLQVYEEEGLITRAKKSGLLLKDGLQRLADKHPSLGKVSGSGLFYMIELVKDRRTAEPLSDYRKPLSEPMLKLNEVLIRHGLSTLIRWNRIVCAPPLIIKPRELQSGLEIIDRALDVADRYCEDG